MSEKVTRLDDFRGRDRARKTAMDGLDPAFVAAARAAIMQESAEEHDFKPADIKAHLDSVFSEESGDYLFSLTAEKSNECVMATRTVDGYVVGLFKTISGEGGDVNQIHIFGVYKDSDDIPHAVKTLGHDTELEKGDQTVIDFQRYKDQENPGVSALEAINNRDIYLVGMMANEAKVFAEDPAQFEGIAPSQQSELNDLGSNLYLHKPVFSYKMN